MAARTTELLTLVRVSRIWQNLQNPPGSDGTRQEEPTQPLLIFPMTATSRNFLLSCLL